MANFEIIVAGALVIAILFGGNWFLAGWAIRGGKGRYIAAVLTSWFLTTIIGLAVFLAFVSIRKRRARAAV